MRSHVPLLELGHRALVHEHDLRAGSLRQQHLSGTAGGERPRKRAEPWRERARAGSPGACPRGARAGSPGPPRGARAGAGAGRASPRATRGARARAPPAVVALTPGSKTEDERNSISVFEAVAPSTVFVINKRLEVDPFGLSVEETPAGAGSGFLWDNKGHVVTNFHVVRNAQALSV